MVKKLFSCQRNKHAEPEVCEDIGREASAPESNTCVEPEPREMAGECFR
jgi:hypothetical protein